MKQQLPLLKESENFFGLFVKKYPNLRPVTLEAWKRCEELDIDLNNVYYIFLSKKELEHRKLENDFLIQAATIYMNYISKALTGIPHIVALADNEGWVLELCGTPIKLGGVDVGIGIGVSCSERHIGKNGVGTALTNREPVLVYGIEHHGFKYKLSSIGVPIRNNGEIIGCLNISVPEEYAHPARLILALGCAASMEKDITIKSGQLIV